MTVVNFDLTDEMAAAGFDPTDGALTCNYVNEFEDGDTLVTTRPFDVTILDGIGSADLAPTPVGNALRVRVPHGTRPRGVRARYVIIPDSPTPVDFTSLVEVDRTTLVAPVLADAVAEAFSGVDTRLDAEEAASAAHGDIVTHDAAEFATDAELAAGDAAESQARTVADDFITNAISTRGRDQRRIGPVTTDITSVVQTNAGDGTLTQQYILGNSAAVPSTYPGRMNLVAPKAQTNAFGYWEPDYPVLGGHIFSVMTDAPKIAFRAGYLSTSYAYQVFVDGAPVTLDPVVGNGQQFLILTFPTAVPRLIEISTRGAFGSIYMAPPYRAWSPGPLPSPKILVMGDSYAMSTVYAADGSTATAGEFGMYHRIRGDLGCVNLSVDGVGGTGYIQRNASGLGAPNNNYADRLPLALALAPDVLIVHGGGANDLYFGASTAQVIAAATALFESARAERPHAKLVFVEGFAPPGFTPGTFNPNYIAIRQGLQAALADVGVYYIDVATTSPWISGTGKIGATTGNGNSDIYVGTDGTHLAIRGHDYVRARMATCLRRILADDGSLTNTLI